MEHIWDMLQDEANKTNCRDRAVACLIYDTMNKKIVSIGHNKHIDSECDCDTTKTAVHAEMMAIANMQQRILRGQLIAFINHRPCSDCASALDKIVKEVRYRSQH